MTGMLASVKNLAEARQVCALGVDIVDLKQPASGALGALDVNEVKQIVTELDAQQSISATIGDLELIPAKVLHAVQEMAATGVNYVKIGVFPDGDAIATIQALSMLSQQGVQLIAVLFADSQPNFKLLPELKIAGFCGVMLDTQNKQLGSLTQVLDWQLIQQFVLMAQKLDLLCGLAGSLKFANIETLLPLQPDYLGFRGGLCKDNNRIATLDSKQIQAIQYQIQMATNDT